MGDYFTIVNSYDTELRVKDSRFIAWITPAASREQAEELIAQRRRSFANATHNCYAWRTGMGQHIAAHASDADEPSGTAGRPMLQALEARQLTNVAAVVTRYFGGTKLGTGGLIRAYGNAVFSLLNTVQLIPLFETSRLQLKYEYADSGAVEKAMRKFAVISIEECFGTEVERIVEVRTECENDFQKAVLDLTAGRIQFSKS